MAIDGAPSGGGCCFLLSLHSSLHRCSSSESSSVVAGSLVATSPPPPSFSQDLVGALEPLARKQRRVVELCELLRSVEVAVEEVDLRQALSNLIEGALLRTNVGGKVEIVSTEAPAGGALVVIDDDGPDMQYMTQMHSLTPFGVDLFSENMVEDNMAWNFVAGLTVSREILESYGCIIRVISPRIMDAAHGAGGTRIELWLPHFSASLERTTSPS